MKKNKKKSFKGFLIAVCIIAGIVLLIIAANLISNGIANKVKDLYSEIGTPKDITINKDNSGNYEIIANRDIKIMQLTDIHIGGGFISLKKDRMALNAVACMITEEKPDLVIMTGDMSFPVPYIAGTFNNMSGARLICNLMDKLGVYYTVAFGNHDSESYSYYNREKMAEYYASPSHKNSLFVKEIEGVDGYGNQMINVKNKDGVITQTVYIFDSHAYTDGDVLGLNWYYDNIHDNQIEWYKNNVLKNKANSVAFFHIPFEEYKIAYDELKGNNFKDTANTKLLFGVAGEKEPMVYKAKYDNKLFETMLELGSTKGVFVGHDHLNNFAYDYKGIQLSYGMSIDYLAYFRINKFGSQRGCNIITLKEDGTFTSQLQNYYQDKYQPKLPKEEVSMEPYYEVS